MSKMLMVGGGIGGLAGALVCAHAGAQVMLFERSRDFSEVGAGIQLGPNVTRILRAWGLKPALDELAVYPDRLQVRSATSGRELGCLSLGRRFEQRYGAPYATIQRADLHATLLRAVEHTTTVQLNLHSTLADFAQDDTSVSIRLDDDRVVQANLLVGADGGWSTVRQQLLDDGPPQATGHLAYRAMVSQRELPLSLRSTQVTAWLGPRLHLVQYPVHCGEWLNVVAIVHGRVLGDMSHWDHSANAADLKQHMALACPPVRALIDAITHWRLWPLSIRPPMRCADEHARGRVALLGDAAHPMVPYLAQGAGMAIEDADVLARVLGDGGAFAPGAAGNAHIPALLRRYAEQRWQRNARVQARAIRNGRIFHATGPLQWGRDVAMRLLGEGLLDMPWLYGETGVK